MIVTLELEGKLLMTGDEVDLLIGIVTDYLIWYTDVVESGRSGDQATLARVENLKARLNHVKAGR